METNEKTTTGSSKSKHVATGVTLQIDPLEGIMAAAVMERFLPVILDTYRHASKPEALELLRNNLYSVVDELAAKSLEKVGIRDALKKKFDGIEVI